MAPSRGHRDESLDNFAQALPESLLPSKRDGNYKVSSLTLPILYLNYTAEKKDAKCLERNGCTFPLKADCHQPSLSFQDLEISSFLEPYKA